MEEEKEFLKPFFEKAEKGHIATAAEIHKALNQHLGEIVNESTVYRLLNRHGWRNVYIYFKKSVTRSIKVNFPFKTYIDSGAETPRSSRAFAKTCLVALIRHNLAFITSSSTFKTLVKV